MRKIEALNLRVNDLSVLWEIHHDSKGIIEFCHIDKKTGGYYKVNRRCQTLIRHHVEPFTSQYNNTSIYYSLNTFKGYKRNADEIFELKALWSDLDFYKTDYTKEQVLIKVEDLVHEGELPQPTFILDSGQGIYLIWKIERTPPNALPRWRDLMNNFHEKLIEYGADSSCVEPARVLRLNGTVNEKNNKTVQIISYSPITYNLASLKGNYLSQERSEKIESDVPRKKAISKQQSKKYTFSGKAKSKEVLYLHNQYKSYLLRLQDIQKLCELRNNEIEKYHCREMMCFLTRYWTYCATKNDSLAYQKALELNESFNVPLRESEFNQRVKVNEKAQRLQAYRYSNKKLIEIMNISEEEQYQLQAIHTKEIQLKKLNAIRKEQRRNDKGLTARQQQKAATEEQVRSLVEKNYSTKEIAALCELSVRQVQRIKKAIDP